MSPQARQVSSRLIFSHYIGHHASSQNVTASEVLGKFATNSRKFFSQQRRNLQMRLCDQSGPGRSWSFHASLVLDLTLAFDFAGSYLLHVAPSLLHPIPIHQHIFRTLFNMRQSSICLLLVAASVQANLRTFKPLSKDRFIFASGTDHLLFFPNLAEVGRE